MDAAGRNQRVKTKHPILEGIVKGRFSLLLFSFALMFLVLPLVPAERGLLDKSIGFFGLAVLLSCLRAITSHRGFFIFMVVLSLLNVGLGSTEILSDADSDAFKTLVLFFRLFYYLLIFGSIMGYVLSSGPVTGNKIAGAISAYLLMGIVWAVAYSLFFQFNPESFSMPEALRGDSTMGLWSFYFSFTTLTTLGYGDVVPRIPAVQSYAVMTPDPQMRIGGLFCPECRTGVGVPYVSERIMVSSILKGCLAACTSWGMLAGIIIISPSFATVVFPSMMNAPSPSTTRTTASNGEVCSLSPWPVSNENRVMFPVSFFSRVLLTTAPSA